MPYSTSCTSPSRLCSACKPVYDYIEKYASDKVSMEDIFPKPPVYTIVFSKVFCGTMPLGTFEKICLPLRTFVKEEFGKYPDMNFARKEFEGADGYPRVGLAVMVDCPGRLEVTNELMRRVFEDEEEDGVDGPWRHEALETIDECQTLQRLLFFEQQFCQ
ncbi:hypothetical protein BDW67DRAFT_189304 [Aspergillus spinulosporus]